MSEVEAATQNGGLGFSMFGGKRRGLKSPCRKRSAKRCRRAPKSCKMAKYKNNRAFCRTVKNKRRK